MMTPHDKIQRKVGGRPVQIDTLVFSVTVQIGAHYTPREIWLNQIGEYAVVCFWHLVHLPGMWLYLYLYLVHLPGMYLYLYLVHLPGMWPSVISASLSNHLNSVCTPPPVAISLGAENAENCAPPYTVSPDSFHLDTSTLCAFTCIPCPSSPNQSIH